MREKKMCPDLIRAIETGFIPNFAPGGTLIWRRDDKNSPLPAGSFFSEITKAGTERFPDAMVQDDENGRLFLIDTNPGMGSITLKRRKELAKMFADTAKTLIFVSAFSSRKNMKFIKFDWESVTWFADEPTHMIHFNGSPKTLLLRMERHGDNK